MAIKIYEQFAPFANPADGDYPHGSIKNDSIPGAEDGTPLDAVWANDYAGFDAALFAQAGVVPSGQPDKLGASQRMDAIKKLMRQYVRRFYSVGDMTSYSEHVSGNKYLVTVDDNAVVYEVGLSGEVALGGGMFAKLLYAKSDNRIAYNQSGSYLPSLEKLTKSPDDTCLFRKVNPERFEIFTPFVQTGRYLRWRYDNNSSQFAAAPDDSAQGYTRPFLQTTVTDVTLETTSDVLASTATASTGPTVSGSYLYVDGVGQYFEWVGIRASRLRMTYNSTTNAGIVKVEINGSSTLVNLVAKDGSGQAIVDTYGGGGGKSTMLADNLPDIDLTVRITVVDKNPASTGFRFYASEQVATGALRRYTAYKFGDPTPTESTINILKLGGSAVDYAISFRPDSQLAANTPFIGSVHGYENRTSLKIFAGNNEIAFDTIPLLALVGAGSFAVEQSTQTYHPDELVLPSANINRSDILSRGGLSFGFTWDWQYAPYVTNGYTTMWTVYGANQGGAGGPLQGWCDRVVLKGDASYPLVVGDSAEYGHAVTDEVIFFGTDTSGIRNADSGYTACHVKISNIKKSFSNFELSKVAEQDALWVQDRATFRKLYLQPLRAAGTLSVDDSLSSSMSVTFYKSKGVRSVLGE